METGDNAVIQVWSYRQAPQSLRPLAGRQCHWIALVPASLVSYEAELLFLRSQCAERLVTRTELSDGSVLLASDCEPEESARL